MRIGFISFRIAGTDGVSLEAERWKMILKRMGHKVTFIAGELDRKGILIPSFHFAHPEVHGVHELVVGNGVNYKEIEAKVFEQAGKIEGEIRELLKMYKFDCLIVANVFSLPIHFSLSVALSRVIEEKKIKTISRNHDFWWERKRYLSSGCFELFEKFFPPKAKFISHVTINSLARKEMEKRVGISSMVIGDCFDFGSSFLSKTNRFNSCFRKDFGLKKDDVVFLQATRIVPRKQIELSIELVRRLKDRRVVLVLAGYAGDESGDYLKRLRRKVRETGIRAKCIGDRVGSERMIREDGRKTYTLWDCFVNADFVTYPSSFEGFGNQFIEAVYFKKPVFINRYGVYKADLEPLGFETVSINGRVTKRAVEEVKSWLGDEEKMRGVVEKNFEIGRKHFSFEATKNKLARLGF